MSDSLLALTITESVILVLYLLIVIHRYAARDVNAYVKSICTVAWMLSFGLLIVLPLDVYDSFHGNMREANIVWTTLYWINFVMTWSFLPITQEYENAGEFTFKQKMWKSLKINLIVYAIGGLIGAIIVIYLMISDKLTFQAILAIMVVLSNGFGLIIIVILLGYGLVTIPKSFYREKDSQITLNKIYSSLSKAQHYVQNYNIDLEDQICDVLTLRNKYRNNQTFSPYFIQMLNQVPEDIVQHADNNKIKNSIEDLDPDNNLSVDRLAKLNKKIKELVRGIERNSQRTQILTEQALFLEDVISSQDNASKKITSDIRFTKNGFFYNCKDRLQWLWYCRMRKYGVLAASIIFSALSILVILAQISIFLKFFGYLNAFSNMLNENQEFETVQILSLIPLGYMLYCIQSGLLSIQVSGFYGFYDHHHTDAPSLLFGSTFLSRISFPLAFNFLWMVDQTDKPISNVVGNFNFESYFASFKTVLPILLIVVTLCNLFDVYDRILRLIGINRFQFQPDYVDEDIHDGQKFSERARQKLKNEIQYEQIGVRHDIQQPFMSDGSLSTL